MERLARDDDLKPIPLGGEGEVAHQPEAGPAGQQHRAMQLLVTEFFQLLQDVSSLACQAAEQNGTFGRGLLCIGTHGGDLTNVPLA